jgi:hypothetical protein
VLSPSNSTTKHAFFSGLKNDTSVSAKANKTIGKEVSEKQKTALIKNNLIASSAAKKTS